jgi:hypothetical protein
MDPIFAEYDHVMRYAIPSCLDWKCQVCNLVLMQQQMPTIPTIPTTIRKRCQWVNGNKNNDVKTSSSIILQANVSRICYRLTGATKKENK